MIPAVRCRKCFVWYHPQHVRPEVCPNCETIADWEDAPLVAWDLSENDKRFLRSLKIAANNDNESDGA